MMDTKTFLTNCLSDLPEIDLSKIPSDPIGYAEASFLKIPLFGELLGIETVILNGISGHLKKLNSTLNLIAAEVKKQHGCKRGDIVAQVIESLSSNGIYSKLKQGEIELFSLKGFETLIELMRFPYDANTLIITEGADYPSALRDYVYENEELLSKVQGETLEEKVKNIGLKIPFTPNYELELVDINSILSMYPKVYENYDTFLFSNTSDILVRILLFTRCGLSHDVLGNIRTSDIAKLIEQVGVEVEPPKKVKSNSAKPKAKNKMDTEVEEDDTKSNQPVDRESADEEEVKAPEVSKTGDDEGK